VWGGAQPTSNATPRRAGTDDSAGYLHRIESLQTFGSDMVDTLI
jgi:hypothetical protein